VLLGGVVIKTVLKICMHMSKKNVSTVQILIKKVINVNQIWNNNNHVRLF